MNYLVNPDISEETDSFYPYLTTSPITEEGSENHFWYIEKAL